MPRKEVRGDPATELTEAQQASLDAFKARVSGPSSFDAYKSWRGTAFDDTAGLQSEVNANQTIIQNKPGPKCHDNILHNYANYTYKISVMTWDSIKDYNKDIQFGKWPLEENNKKILFSSGGIADDSVTVSHPALGGVTTASRHPEFDVDFYISAFTTTSIMGLSGESRATNIFECDMQVIEPIGATLLERFYTLVTRNGRENWAEFPLLIKIEFIGYDDAGNPEYIKPAMRQIPVRLINMAFDVAGDGTSYSLQFIASTTIKKDHPRNIKMESEELWGNTIQEFCDQFAENYNKAQEARTYKGANKENEALERSLAASGSDFGDGFATSRAKSEEGAVHKWDGAPITGPKVQSIADEIEFVIDEKIRNAKITVEVPVAEDTPLDPTPTFLFDDQAGEQLTAVEKLRAKTKTNKALKAAGKVEKEKAKGNKKIVAVDQSKPTKITIAAGTKQIAVIEKIITFSAYITDQLINVSSMEEGTSKSKLSDSKLLKNPEQGLLWWKVSYIPTFKGWDDARGQYAMKTIIQIEPYRVHDPATTGGKCTVGEGVIAPAMRNYQYIYTGQNIDIKDFGISFNNAFIQSILGQGTADSKKAKVAKAGTNQSGPRKDQQSALVANSADQITTAYNTRSNLTSTQNTAGTILENLYRKLGSDMMQCSISIVGDPLYIQQDGILNLGSKSKTGTINNTLATDPANGAALCDHQDAHIFLSYKTPTDYNDETGLMDFNMGDPRHRSSTLSGYYRVWEVVNTFQNGEFNQSLNLTRVYNQWREQKHNPEKEGGGNDRAEFTQEGASLSAIASSIRTTGGAAAFHTPSSSALTTKQKKQIARQKLDLQNQNNIESTALMSEATDPGVLTQQDYMTTSSNTQVANQNAVNKQNTDEAKIKFRQAEAKLANINKTYDSTSAGQENTNADRVNARVSNVTGLETRFDGDGETPVSIEKAGEPAGVPPQSHGQEGKDWWIDDQGRMNIIIRGQSGVNSTTNGNAPLFNYNKKDGLYGLSEQTINMASYTPVDKASVNTNNEIIRTHRELLIATGDLAAKKNAYAIANAASKINQTIHGKYGNTFKTWEEVGYFQNLLVS